jgi:hypothetical protein
VHCVPFLPALLFQPTDLSWGKTGESLKNERGKPTGKSKERHAVPKRPGLIQSYPESLKSTFFLKTLQVSHDFSEVYILK